MESKELSDLEAKLNEFGIYSGNLYDSLKNDEGILKDEPQIPNLKKSWADETLQKHIAEANNRDANIDFKNIEITPEIVSNSVGNKKIIKKIIKVIVPIGLAALVTLGSINGLNETKKNNYRENYIVMEDYEINTEYDKHYDLKGTGERLAYSIIEKSNSTNFDLLQELVLGLGLACEKVNKMSPLTTYNLNKAYDYTSLRIDFEGWVEQIYDSMKKVLAENGIINLPETLRELLVEFGFSKGIYNCNPITGTLEFTPKEDVSDKEMIKSLLEYASSLGITNGEILGGRKNG